MFDMEGNPRRGGGFDIHPRSPEIKKYCRRKIKHLTELEKKQGKALGYKEGAATVKWRKKQMKILVQTEHFTSKKGPVNVFGPCSTILRRIAKRALSTSSLSTSTMFTL